MTPAAPTCATCDEAAFFVVAGADAAADPEADPDEDPDAEGFTDEVTANEEATGVVVIEAPGSDEAGAEPADEAGAPLDAPEAETEDEPCPLPTQAEEGPGWIVNAAD